MRAHRTSRSVQGRQVKAKFRVTMDMDITAINCTPQEMAGYMETAYKRHRIFVPVEDPKITESVIKVEVLEETCN